MGDGERDGFVLNMNMDEYGIMMYSASIPFTLKYGQYETAALLNASDSNAWSSDNATDS